MKIGIVAPEFPPDTVGGGGIVFEALARGLHDRGHDVRVLTSATWGSPRADDRCYPFPVARVAQLQHFTRQYIGYMPPVPRSLYAARAFLADCEVVHLHGYGVPFVDAVFAFFAHPRRSVFTSHGYPYTAPRAGGLLTAAYRLYDRAFGANIARKSCRLSAVSSEAAQEMRAATGRHVAVIPNGFTPLAPAVRCAPAAESAMQQGPYLLCVGRIEALKGFDLAVRALRRLREERPDLRLIIAGAHTTQQRALAELIARNRLDAHVSFPGRVSRPELMRLYENAACCVVSSYYESFSLVTLEAMSCGTPAVVARVGGIKDLARDEWNALTFEAGDVEGIVRAVSTLESKPDLRRTLVENGYATVARFTWPEVVKQYLSLYEACAHR